MNDSFNINIDAYMPLREVVFKSIRDAILSGSLKPGERLMEKDLAEKLGVSRTPIREALRKLELEGFVEMVPRKGAMVKKVTGKEIKDVLEVRAALESLAAKVACTKMDDADKKRLTIIRDDFEQGVNLNDVDIMAQKDVEFHDLIFLSTENDRLIQIINNLREQIYRYRVTYLYDKKYQATIVKEHVLISEAIIKGDAQTAQEQSIIHINNQQRAIIGSLKESMQL